MAIGKERMSINMNYYRKALCLLLCIVSLFGIFAVGAVADDILDIPGTTPQNAKTSSAYYEIIVHSWDYSNKDTDEKAAINSVEPYRVGPLDTTVYKLENGKGDYWLNQLASYTGKWEYVPDMHVAGTGFCAENMISFFKEKNGGEYLFNDSLNSSLVEFFVQIDGKDVKLTTTHFTFSGFYEATYASPFQVSELPGTIPFTIRVDTSPVYSDDGIECVFYGTINYTYTAVSFFQRIINFLISIFNWFKSFF